MGEDIRVEVADVPPATAACRKQALSEKLMNFIAAIQSLELRSFHRPWRGSREGIMSMCTSEADI